MKFNELSFKAIFSNLKGIKNFEVDSYSGHYFNPIEVNEVTLEIDGFEALTIDNPEQYSEVQLAQFDYYNSYPYEEMDKKELVLINYKLESFIPIHVLKIESGEIFITEFQIILVWNEKLAKRSCVILGKCSKNLDLGCAFIEIQEQLKEEYYLMTCSNCKNYCWHPDVGFDFYNQLCFKSKTEEFQAIKDKNKMSIAELMNSGNKNDNQLVHLTDYCDSFDPK
jgi:hypothetical protein